MYPNASVALEAELVRLREQEIADAIFALAHDMDLPWDDVMTRALALLRAEFEAGKVVQR